MGEVDLCYLLKVPEAFGNVSWREGVMQIITRATQHVFVIEASKVLLTLRPLQKVSQNGLEALCPERRARSSKGRESID